MVFNLRCKLILAVLLLISSFTAFADSFVGGRTDFRDETIYFVITTRFYDGDQTNNTYCWDGNDEHDPEWRGDFKGLIDKLDYIKALGFSAIWITPVVENASGFDYHGYHAFNFSKVDPRYESTDCTLQTLIDAVHAKGMKLIVDIVLNHTGNFGENHLCHLFDKDYTKNLSNIDKTMIPTAKLPSDYGSLIAGRQYAARLSKMKNTPDENGNTLNYDSCNYWHHYGNFNWDEINCQWAQIAGDCVDLNTENPMVENYLVRCYEKFIKMGVDAFRIDTGRHINRLNFNKVFNNAFLNYAKSVGNNNFFMFAEICTRYRNAIYRDHPGMSTPYYTWKDDVDYAWDTDSAVWKSLVCMTGEEGFTGSVNQKSCIQNYTDDDNTTTWCAKHNSTNALLEGNDYHTPDYSRFSGLSVIDFPMHHSFASTASGFGMHTQDNLYNDATFNVTYVDSHDYAPDGAPENERFAQPQSVWASNLDLMYTFRGIPCLYYGSEIEFKKGCEIDKGTLIQLKNSGRAYFGGYITGSVKANDFADYSDATGNMAATLSHPLALHIQRLAKLRLAIPALRKGQYSTDGCSGKIAFKRRYTNDTTDSYVLVTISDSCKFTNILNGTYVDAITGDTQTVTDNSLTVPLKGDGNMRVYVLNTAKTPAPGKVGTDGKYLYASAPVIVPQASYDGNEEAGDYTTVKDSSTGGGTDTIAEPDTIIAPHMNKGEQAVFFERSDSTWGTSIKAWVWNSTKNFTGGNWPGQKLTYLGNKIYKWEYTGTDKITGKVIFNDGSKQTADLDYVNGGYYNANGYVKTIDGAGEISDSTKTDTTSVTSNWTVYFDKPSAWGTSINAYVYDKDNGSVASYSSWPGTAMTLVSGSRYKFSFTMPIKKGWILFNDGRNQTKGDPGFELVNNAIYDVNGIVSSGISSTLSNGTVKVYGYQGILYINSPISGKMNVYGLDGSVRTVEVNSGLNAIDTLGHGFYIVAGKKVIL
jgi:glycosidase